MKYVNLQKFCSVISACCEFELDCEIIIRWQLLVTQTQSIFITKWTIKVLHKIQFYLNWINIMGNYNKLSFLGFNQVSDMINSIFNINWFLSRSILFTSSFAFSLGSQSGFLLSSCLRSVFVEKFEKLSSYKERVWKLIP